VLHLALTQSGGRDLVIAGGPSLRRWDLATLRPLAPLSLPEPATVVAATQTHLATGSESGKVRLLTLGGRTRRLLDHDEPVTALAVREREGSPTLLVRCLGGRAYDGDGEYGFGGVVREYHLATGADTGFRLELEELGCLAAGGSQALVGSGKGLSLVTDTRVQKLPVVHDRLVVDATQLTVGGQPCWVSVDAFALWLHTVAGKRVTQTLLHRDVRSEERRVGKECRRLCRSRWSPYH
jgi:hypothetical protein